MRTVVVYYGRFQPVHLGHVAVYNNLTKKFGRQNVYIGTSNKTDGMKNPLSYEWKKKLWMKHGVQADHILQTRRNYNAEEIKATLKIKSFEDFKFVIAVGQKDGSRLGGAFYKKLPSNIKAMRTADNVGYFYVIPNVSMGGKVMNASALRDILKSDELDNADFDFVMKQTGLKKRDILQMKKLFEHQRRKANWHLLTEGGAGGHMMHPFEDLTMTFGDIKDIIKASFEGKLEVKSEGPITEKVDGQNLFATVINGKVRFARNKGQLKSSGAAAMNIADIKKKWAGAPSVQGAFLAGARALTKGFGSLPKKTQEEIFTNGEHWVNFEVISHKNPNVINYDEDVIIFHNIQIVNQDGNVVGSASKSAAKLFSVFASAKKSASLKMSIQPPKIIKADKNMTINFAKDQNKFISDISSFAGKEKLGDGNTLGDYLESVWTKEIQKIADKHTVTVPTAVKKHLLNRFVRIDKSYRLTNLSKDVKDAGFIDDIKKLDKTVIDRNKKELQPIENLVLKFGVLLLQNIDTFLAASPDESVAKLKANINTQIATIKSSKNSEDIAKMTDLLKKIDVIGGFKGLVPSEGIVFRYKNKIYKITGLFAPVNQLMGLGRFG